MLMKGLDQQTGGDVTHHGRSPRLRLCISQPQTGTRWLRNCYWTLGHKSMQKLVLDKLRYIGRQEADMKMWRNYSWGIMPISTPGMKRNRLRYIGRQEADMKMWRNYSWGIMPIS